MPKSMIQRIGSAIEAKLQELSGGDYTMNYIAGNGALGSEELARAAIAAIRPDDGTARFLVLCDGEYAAEAEGPAQDAFREAKHYAAVYGQDGPVEVFEVIHMPVDLSPLKAEQP